MEFFIENYYIVLTTLFGALLAFVSVSHLKQQKRMVRLEKERQKLIKKLDQTVTELQAEGLKAGINEKSNEQLLKFEKVSEEILNSYKQALGEIKDKNLNVIQTASEEIKEGAEKGVEGLRETLKDETIESTREVQDKISKEFELAKQEVEQYKASEMKKVDEKVFKIVQSVSKLVIGETITIDKQEELVLNALDKAKADLASQL